LNFKIGMRIPPKIKESGMEKVVQFASKIGLDVIDVPRLTEADHQIMSDAGLEIGTVDAVHFGGPLLSKDETKRAEAIEGLKNQLSHMSQLKVDKMFIVFIPEEKDMPRKESFAIWKESFPEVVKHAEQKGVYIAMEGWPGPAPQYPVLGCTPEMYRAMFEAVPSKHFGINYDPSHYIRLGIDYLRVISEFGERIIYCHGKDTEILPEEMYESGHLPATFGAKYKFSEGSWRYTIPGHGVAEWDKIAARLEQIGYQGAISIELEDHRYWGSLELEQQGIIKSFENLSRFFK